MQKRILPHVIFTGVLFTAACQGESDEGGSEASGKRIYRERCASCHGKDGTKGVSGAKDLSASELSMKERMKVIRNGKGAMIPFEGNLSEEEIEAVAAYLDELETEAE